MLKNISEMKPARKETSTTKKNQVDGYFITKDGIKILNGLGIDEAFIKKISASEPEKTIKVKCPVCYLHFISEGQNDMIGEEGYYRSVKGLFTKMTMFRFKCENCCREWELKMVMHL